MYSMYFFLYDSDVFFYYTTRFDIIYDAIKKSRRHDDSLI